MVYVIYRGPQVKECYVGQATDAESRYYQHFMYGDIPFLPTIEGLEDIVRRGEQAPYYEVVDIVPREVVLQREREVAAELASRGYVVHGGR